MKRSIAQSQVSGSVRKDNLNEAPPGAIPATPSQQSEKESVAKKEDAAEKDDEKMNETPEEDEKDKKEADKDDEKMDES